MIWATVSYRSCFCWLYRASQSLAAETITSLISELTIWLCPCVESSLVCWKRMFAMTSAFSCQNSVSLCPASFCTPRPNLSVTPGISWSCTFAFQSPMRNQRSNCQHPWSSKKQESSRKTSTSALLTVPKPLCWSQQTVENSWRVGNTRPPDLPPEKSVCWSRSNS